MSLATAQRAVETPDDVALSDERGAISWSEADRLLNRSVNALLAQDFQPGSRLAVFAENACETVLAHLSGILAGISTVPINFHLTAAELPYILEDSGASAVFVAPETAAVEIAFFFGDDGVCPRTR